MDAKRKNATNADHKKLGEAGHRPDAPFMNKGIKR
jgi:hypothetical protein